ncbi:arabinose-proton symporter [Sporormia fimetaria CBS 119925]|uniref:Arabinose-proton symporter n=1 Tax=Sporormia fimetaria CBS 119925 TaxID=1340428 RepID=A0A6A6UW24_9PLEO|nr:arabinose-proton symporter [Sporormia fimetaria CBS 119925]
MTRTSGYNVAVGLIVALGSFTYGFGFSSFASSIGQPGFFAYFNLTQTGEGASYTNNILGAINALFFFGACAGALIGGPAADRWGRKWALMTSSVIAIIGGALTAGSVHVAMLILVRIIQGTGLGALATLVPIYLSEASTPEKRGMLTGMHGFFLVSGYSVSAWVGFGCYFSDNLTFGWRGPLAFTCVPPLVLLIGCLWVPESPRWLVMKGRNEEAWTVLSRLHNDPNDPEAIAAHEEFYQMKKQIEFESKNPSGYVAIFTTKAYRKRAFLSCYVQYAANATGALVINYYSVIIYTNLGLTGYLPLLMYCAYATIGAIGNLFSLLTVDKTGRRPVLLLGFIGCFVCVVIEAAMVGAFVESDNPNIGGQKVAIVAIMMFVFFYGLFIDAASFIYSSEIYPTNIRSEGVALATFTYFTACITFVTPGATAIANIGYKYFIVFACLTLVSALIIYFLYPETKGKSLEELAELFGDPVVVHLTGATEEEKRRMDKEMKGELDVEHHEVA